MSKTLFSDKCVILAELWLNFREEAATDEAWSEFFSYNDISLPLSYMITDDLAYLNTDSDGEELIEETWKMFCEYVNVDPEAEYTNIEEVFLASPQPMLNPEDGE